MREAREAVEKGLSPDTPQFVDLVIKGMTPVADKLERLINDDLAMDRKLSAGDKLLRQAAILNCIDSVIVDFEDPRKILYFDRAREALKKAVALAGAPHDRSRFIQIPFEGVKLDAIFTSADGHGPAPLVIHLNGTHSQIEWQYLIGITHQLAKRGIASLAIDHPGSGSARYHHGLKYRPDPEVYVSSIIDHLSAFPEVDHGRIGLCGSSFGAIFAPRVTAHEPRVKACVSWCPGYSYPIERYFPDGRPKSPAPVATPETEARLRYQRWAHGAKDNQDLYDKMQQYSVEDVMPGIKVPLLIVHGLNDPQTLVSSAERMLMEATASPRAELLVIGPDIGGDMHCNLDNPRTALNAISDWLAEIFVKRGG